MKQRIFSALITICLLMHSCFLPAYAQDVEIDEDGYITFNLETGESTYHAFPDTPNTGNNLSSETTAGFNPSEETAVLPNASRAIIGVDNRYPVYNTMAAPYNCTVHVSATLSDGYTTKATGVLIGPSAVLTAAHCVFDREHGGVVTSACVIPGRNGDIYPYGSATVSSTNIQVSSLYIQTGNPQVDWAIIELDTPIGNQSGWASIMWQAASYNNTYVYNTGYPNYGTVGAQNEDSTKMFLSLGYIRDSYNLYLLGDFDATGGHSGGPVFLRNSSGNYVVIGILTAGSATETDGSDYPTAYSYVTRITQDMYNLFAQYSTG